MHPYETPEREDSDTSFNFFAATIIAAGVGGLVYLFMRQPSPAPGSLSGPVVSRVKSPQAIASVTWVRTHGAPADITRVKQHTTQDVTRVRSHTSQRTMGTF